MHDDPVSRRRFLQQLGAGAAFGAAMALRPGWTGAAWAAAGPFAPGRFPVIVGGEDNRVGHMLRDGHAFATPKPSRRVDVVIVGAGVSGLTAAHNLKGADLLLLEKEDRPGGHARKGRWRDVTYGEGAAYLAECAGYVATLVEELNVPLTRIAEPGDAYWPRRAAVGDFWAEGADKLPFSARARNEFKRFRRDVLALSAGKDAPPLPVETASAGALALDRRSFGDLARGYGPEVHRYLDLYCRSALGGPVDQVSAYWGLNFLGGEYGARYTAPGGNAVFGESLLAAVGPERVLTGATVIRVAHVGDRAWVTYVRGAEVVTVEARAVIMACSKQITKHVVAELPADQKAAMGAMRYQPYLVANVCVDGPLARTAYDTWRPGASFVDAIVADWTDPDPARRHGVLTAYAPLPEAERYRLLDDEAVRERCRRIVGDLDALYPGLARRVVEVRAYRRGHPMVLSAPGAVTTLRPVATRPFGLIQFANSDSQMTATIEAAIWEGRQTALRVKSALASVHAAPAARP